VAINSRAKGASGERAACESLKETFGWSCRRSQQHCATDSASDIIVTQTPNCWWEIKRVQKINVAAVMERSKQDCGTKVPVLMHRPNHTEWMVTVYLSDLKAFLNEISSTGSLAQEALPDADKGEDLPRTR
jgi:hypothetical protein